MQHHHVSHVTHRSPHLDAESLQVSVGEHDSCLAGAPLGRIGLPPAPDTPHDSHKGMALPLTVTSVIDEALSRGRWLLGLLICQSMSAKILESFRELIRDHLVVTLFLTMLVGAGGNAGNQSAIKVRQTSMLLLLYPQHSGLADATGRAARLSDSIMGIIQYNRISVFIRRPT